MSSFLQKLGAGLSGFGAGMQDPSFAIKMAQQQQDRERLQQLGGILSGQAIPAFMKNTLSPEQIEQEKLGLLGSLGTPEAINVLGKFVETPQSRLEARKAEADIELAKANAMKARMGPEKPSDVRTYEYYLGLSPERQSEFLKVKRIGEEEAFKKALAQKTGTLTGQAQFDLPTTLDKAQQSVNLLDDLMKHPGLQTSVGAKGFTGGLAFGIVPPGTDAADFRTLLDQIKGSQFLEAYQSLKGGGSITEKEGEKAEKAIARMSTAQTEKEFIRSAKEFKDTIQRGMERAKQQAATGYTPPGSSNLPPEKGVRPVVIKVDENFNVIK